MAFYEFNTWKLKADCDVSKYGEMMEGWLKFVNANKKELFPEWISVKYYEQCTREEGSPTGVYNVLFEYDSKETCQKFKDRDAKTNIYEGYPQMNPALYYEQGSEEIVYMEPDQEKYWFDYTEEKLAKEEKAGVQMRRFLEYEVWKVHSEVKWEEYDDMIVTWFTYCVEHKDRLFEPWVSARYYRQCDINGNYNGVYVMLFEYDCIEGHHSYKAGKLHSYAVNDGRYAQYALNDPYQFFDLDTVNIDCIQPMNADNWVK